MKEIYFVRHGETTANKENTFRGRKDYPLNENGIKQAQQAAKALKNISFDNIFSSPLKRAWQTAEIIVPDKKIIKDENLNNIDIGSWSGMDKDIVKENYPKLWRKWLTNPEEINFPEGGSVYELLNRTKKFVESLKSVSGEKILVVSHRSVMKCLFAAILGIEKNFFWKFYFNNASYSKIIFEAERGFTIMKMNESNHLDNFVIERS